MPFNFHGERITNLAKPAGRGAKCPRARIPAQLLFTSLIICLLLLASCQLAPPQAPKWETEINLPIINKRFAMQEIIADEDDFYADQNGLVHFAAETQLDSFYVGERLAINSLQQSFEYRLGRFQVPAPTPLNAEISLRQIFPAAATLAGQTAPIPPFAFSLSLLDFQDYDSFIFVDGATGTLTVYLRNGFPVPLGPLQIDIRDGSVDTTIVTFEHNAEIPPNGAMTRVLDLVGRTFSNRITFVISGQSAGSRGNLVLINPDSKSQLTLTASSLQVNGARARLATQTIEDQGTVEVGDSLHLVFARVKSGAITLNLQGNFPVRTKVSIALPDFRSPWNDTLKSAITLSPNSGGSLSLDLAGYTLQPQPAAFGQQKIRFLWKVSTLNASHEFVAITSAASLSATCASTKIIFSEVQGAFIAKQIALEPQTFNLDLPAGLDSLRLLDTRLQIILRNGINFPVQTDLRLEGFPERGPKAQLVIRERITPAQANGMPVETQILLAGNAMQNFLNALPRTIRVSGKVWVGQRSYSGSVRERDAVATTLRFEAPLALVLPAQKVESEVSTILLDESTREHISKNLASGGAMLRLDNRLPCEASAAVHLARKANEVFSKPDLIVGPVQIALPQIDAITGRALQPRRSEATLALNETQLKLFQTSPLYVGVLLTLPGSNGKVIRIAVDDYVDVQAGVNLRLQMNENTLQ